MGSQIENKDIIDLIARLLRVKMSQQSDWSIILGDQDLESFTRGEIFDALSTPCEYSTEERIQHEYSYRLKIGGKSFLLIYNPVTDKIEVYLPGQTLGTPYLSFSVQFLSSLKGE